MHGRFYSRTKNCMFEHQKNNMFFHVLFDKKRKLKRGSSFPDTDFAGKAKSISPISFLFIKCLKDVG